MSAETIQTQIAGLADACTELREEIAAAAARATEVRNIARRLLNAGVITSAESSTLYAVSRDAAARVANLNHLHGETQAQMISICEANGVDWNPMSAAAEAL